MTYAFYPIIIFYDGACQMCIRQMNKFRRKDKHNNLIFTDISRTDFNPRKFGLENAPIQKYIYAQDSNGHIVHGVDAFIWMWRACGNNLLSFFIGLPIIKQLGKAIYRTVSKFRYRISGKSKNICDWHCVKEI